VILTRLAGCLDASAANLRVDEQAERLEERLDTLRPLVGNVGGVIRENVVSRGFELSDFQFAKCANSFEPDCNNRRFSPKFKRNFLQIGPRSKLH